MTPERMDEILRSFREALPEILEGKEEPWGTRTDNPCQRCTMTFREAPPATERTEISKCPDCGRRFWHAQEDPYKGARALAGIW